MIALLGLVSRLVVLLDHRRVRLGALEAGDVILMTADPKTAVDAIGLARRTFSIIRQNLFWAFVYNTAAIPLAALGFLNPMIAAAAMALSSVSVVTNSLRLRSYAR